MKYLFLVLLLSLSVVSAATPTTKQPPQSPFKALDQALAEIRERERKAIVCSGSLCWTYVHGTLRGYPSGIKRAYINVFDANDGEWGSTTKVFYAADCYHGKLGIGEPKDAVYPNSPGESIFRYLCKPKK